MLPSLPAAASAQLQNSQSPAASWHASCCAQCEVLSPEAAAHVPHAGAHSTSPIESAGAVVATDDELCDFLLDAACLDRRILQQSLDKLHNEDVFMVSDLQLLDELGGLSRVFTPVTAKKVADALSRRAAAGASLAQAAVAPLQAAVAQLHATPVRKVAPAAPAASVDEESTPPRPPPAPAPTRAKRGKAPRRLFGDDASEPEATVVQPLAAQLRAAQLIQAAWRGLATRRNLQRAHSAATRIGACWRGYDTRAWWLFEDERLAEELAAEASYWWEAWSEVGDPDSIFMEAAARIEMAWLTWRRQRWLRSLVRYEIPPWFWEPPVRRVTFAAAAATSTLNLGATVFVPNNDKTKILGAPAAPLSESNHADEKQVGVCEKGPLASGANPATHAPLEEEPVCATVLHTSADGPPGPDTTPTSHPISRAKPDRHLALHRHFTSSHARRCRAPA